MQAVRTTYGWCFYRAQYMLYVARTCKASSVQAARHADADSTASAALTRRSTMHAPSDSSSSTPTNIGN